MVSKNVLLVRENKGEVEVFVGDLCGNGGFLGGDVVYGDSTSFPALGITASCVYISTSG
jgi:hypothetical protein